MATASAEFYQLPLTEIVLGFLRRGKAEPYELHPRGVRALEVALKICSLTGRDMLEQLDGLIGLACTLQTEHRSPTAAQLIWSQIQASSSAMECLRTEAKGAQRARDRFARFQGLDQRRAPKLDEKQPNGALKLSSFLTPGQQGTARAGLRRGAAKAGIPQPSKSVPAASTARTKLKRRFSLK